MIRSVVTDDAEAIARIYNHYILNSIITFEEQAVTPATVAERISETVSSSLPWFVVEESDSVVGYAYASKWRGRCAYRFAVESTVYLDSKATGKGYGSALYRALIDDLRTKSLHVVIGGVALPNEASVALHEKCGFEKVAHFKQVGWKFGRWIDVGYWQLFL